MRGRDGKGGQVWTGISSLTGERVEDMGISGALGVSGVLGWVLTTHTQAPGRARARWIHRGGPRGPVPLGHTNVDSWGDGGHDALRKWASFEKWWVKIR